MTLEEKEYLREFLEGLYGKKVQSWLMDERMFELTMKLISESASCSDLMDLVPRPMSPGKSALKWMKAEARKLFLRQLATRKDHYSVCLKAAAYHMAFDFEMAASHMH